ncbi:serine/threonine protein kinase [Peribacillus acanthi]|uniref:serine/threonine protein kinase n=1 Tax=Peribacillus acanthi TaxID=2171554 RepID=UPI0030B80FDE
MMMNNTMRNLCNIAPGSTIQGKWNKGQYKVIKELGYGANGIVYLAEKDKLMVALKISDNSASITSEMNILKSFSKVQGSALGPSFIEADDWVRNGKILPFYVMEYIQGDSFLPFIQKKGHGWTGVLMLQLLASLDELHANGWIFGDIKPENLIVTQPNSKIRCVDVGGTTIIGRSVKEFTEFFDRGYWGLGSRKAEPSYDLFAVAMVMINSAYPNRFQKGNDNLSILMNVIDRKTELHPYKDILEKALRGRYTRATEMRKDLFSILNSQSRTKKTVIKQKPVQVNTSTTRIQPKKIRRKSTGYIETFVILLVVSFLYALYIYMQILS